MMASAVRCLLFLCAPSAVVAAGDVSTCSESKTQETRSDLLNAKRVVITEGGVLVQARNDLLQAKSNDFERIASATVDHVAADDEAAEKESATEKAQDNETAASDAANGSAHGKIVSSAVFSESSGNSSQGLDWWSRRRRRTPRHCSRQGAHCWWDWQCCGKMKCLGIVRWQCGHTPAWEGEYCNVFYPCDKHLLCHHGKCTDYKNVLSKGTKGTCKAGTSSGKIKVMTYNLFLIKCLLPGKHGGKVLTCQPEKEQKVRIQKLMQWMKERDEDVVVVQELFHLREDVIDGMAAAGFCHYVATPFGQTGSGMATFSKYPITTSNFLDWFDWTGKNSDTLFDPEAVADKGVMYAKIKKDGENYHVFNAHTQSNSMREHHDTRIGQYAKIRDFARQVARIAGNELILFGGDFNEDKYKHHNNQKFYKEMLEELHAVEPKVRSNLQHTLDTAENPMLANLWAGTPTETFKELLDYVLISQQGKQPRESHCEILKPQWPKDCSKAECMLSDHFPNTCTFL